MYAMDHIPHSEHRSSTSDAFRAPRLTRRWRLALVDDAARDTTDDSGPERPEPPSRRSGQQPFSD
jgi:hypothetical protein